MSHELTYWKFTELNEINENNDLNNNINTDVKDNNSVSTNTNSPYMYFGQIKIFSGVIIH